MVNNLDPREHRTSPAAPKSREIPATRPIADREVPIARHQIPAAVQAWLDGDLPESAARRADVKGDVDFWLRVDREMQARRELRTPAHLHQQIMDALPESHATSAWPDSSGALWGLGYQALCVLFL